MLANFSSFRGQGPREPYTQVTQGVRTLRRLDGTPGDKNQHKDAISMQTSRGQLDVVVFSNPDDSQTVVQRITNNSGLRQTTWMEVPAKGNGVPNLDGFEIYSKDDGYLAGSTLEVKESYNGSFGIPSRTYGNRSMNSAAASNALMRADAVLAGYEIL